jgi:rhamnosyltransferase
MFQPQDIANVAADSAVCRVGAVVVLYQPDLGLLKRLIACVVNQVERVYVVDNTPGACQAQYGQLLAGESIFYHPLLDNLGIATAHNCGIKLAKAHGLTHVLLMDQDSELEPRTVEKLLENERILLAEGVKVAAIGPVFVDEKTGDAAPAIERSNLGSRRVKIDLSGRLPVRSTYIIASGSLVRITVLDRVGGMLDDLFIDWVDIEWGERASQSGYYCYLVPQVKMKHSIGDEFVSVLGRRITLHSDFRNYFIVRNAAFLAMWSNLSAVTRFQMLRKIPYYIVCYSWYSKRRVYALRLLLTAVKDGFIKKMGKGYFK